MTPVHPSAPVPVPGDPIPSDPIPGRPPRALDVVLAGAVVEGLALGAGVVWAATDLVRGRSASPGASVVLALFLAGTAAAVVAAARALRRGTRRARGVVVTWQLLQAATGVTFLGVAGLPTGLPWAAAAAVGLAVIVLAAALSPASLAFTAAREAEALTDG